MNSKVENLWNWKEWQVGWESAGKRYEQNTAIVLIHGFGANKSHWRHNLPFLSQITMCYAIDLIGFGESSQPISRLNGEKKQVGDFIYGFDSWGEQVADFCKEVIKKPVILIGNSIGGVIALRASQLLAEQCRGIVLIDCAQRTLDDKRLAEQPFWARRLRPVLKTLVKRRWLSKNLFRNAANPYVIKRVLEKAYPSGENIDQNLVNLLLKPSQRPGAAEAFRGFINLFDDYLAPNLMQDLDIPVNLIWGENDPWEPLEEARKWSSELKCIRSLEVIPRSGHCPHDESPELVNSVLLKLIQQAM